MPTRYILAANQIMPIKVTNSSTKDTIICQRGAPNGIRIIITIGEVKGIIEKTVAKVPCGSFITTAKPI